MSRPRRCSVTLSASPRSTAHHSSSDQVRMPHFSRSLREVGSSNCRDHLWCPDLHLHHRPVIHDDRPNSPESVSSEAAPPPQIGSLHQPAFYRIAMYITQFLAMRIARPVLLVQCVTDGHLKIPLLANNARKPVVSEVEAWGALQFRLSRGIYFSRQGRFGHPPWDSRVW